MVLLEAWRDLEKGLPRAQQQVGEVAKLMPTKVKKRRLVQAEGEGDQAEVRTPQPPRMQSMLSTRRPWKKTGEKAVEWRGGCYWARFSSSSSSSSLFF